MKIPKTHWEKAQAYDTLISDFRVLFKLSKLSITKLANKAGVGVGHLQGFTEGTRDISPIVIQKLLRALIEESNYQTLVNEKYEKSG